VDKHDVRRRFETSGIIAAIRVDSAEDALFAAEAVTSGGVSIIEIPLTVPEAAQVIAALGRTLPHAVVGAGGVGTVSAAKQCLDAGAQFLTSDGFQAALVEFAAQHEILAYPGALTPTEVITAWEARADFVKVVPCVQIGGEAYLGSLHRMFPQIPLIASGGVNQVNAANFIVAGAAALGIGRELVPPDAIRLRQHHRIAELARRFLGFVQAGRNHLEARRGRPPVIHE